MHYGFVGKAAGFSNTTLRAAAGFVQITNGTAKKEWLTTYFDDPNDQHWINYGINMWDDQSLPIPPGGWDSTDIATRSSSSKLINPINGETYTRQELIDLLTPQEKKDILKDVKRITRKIQAKNN